MWAVILESPADSNQWRHASTLSESRDDADRKMRLMRARGWHASRLRVIETDSLTIPPQAAAPGPDTTGKES